MSLGADELDRRPHHDPTLIRALRTAHRLTASKGRCAIASPEAANINQTPDGPYERSLLRLAFLAPDLQAQIFEGRQPSGVTIQSLIRGAMPSGLGGSTRLDWGAVQAEKLGFQVGFQRQRAREIRVLGNLPPG